MSGEGIGESFGEFGEFWRDLGEILECRGGRGELVGGAGSVCAGVYGGGGSGVDGAGAEASICGEDPDTVAHQAARFQATCARRERCVRQLMAEEARAAAKSVTEAAPEEHRLGIRLGYRPCRWNLHVGLGVRCVRLVCGLV